MSGCVKADGLVSRFIGELSVKPQFAPLTGCSLPFGRTSNPLAAVAALRPLLDPRAPQRHRDIADEIMHPERAHIFQRHWWARRLFCLGCHGGEAIGASF